MKRSARPGHAQGSPPVAGFTLVEILVVIAIVALLAALAFPSYSAYVQRGHRAEAVRTLLEMAACQERLRAGTGYYDTGQCKTTGANRAYRFHFEPAEASQSLRFRAIANPTEPDPGDSCGRLSLDQSGTRAIGGPPERLADCWGGR